METPVYKKLVQDIEAAKYLFIFFDFSERQEYYPVVPNYSPPEFQGKSYHEYLKDCTNILNSLRKSIRTIGLEMQLLLNEKPDVFERSAKFLHERCSIYVRHIDRGKNDNAKHRDGDRTPVENICIRKLSALNDGEFSSPGQLQDMFCVIIMAVRQNIPTFNVSDEVPKALKEISFTLDNAFEKMLFIKYSGLLSSLCTTITKNDGSPHQAKIAGVLAYVINERDSNLKTYLTDVINDDKKTKNNAIIYTQERLEKVIKTLDDADLDTTEAAKKLEQIIKNKKD